MCRLQYTICTLLKKGLRPFFFVLTVAFQSTCMLWHATCDAALPRALSWCRWGWALEARREPVAHGMRIRPNPVQESSGRACWSFCLFFVPEKGLTAVPQECTELTVTDEDSHGGRNSMRSCDSHSVPPSIGCSGSRMPLWIMPIHRGPASRCGCCARVSSPTSPRWKTLCAW